MKNGGKIVMAAVLAAVVGAQMNAKADSKSIIEVSRPFTHFAHIPATSDPKSIKFERVKVTKVFTQEKITWDPAYCAELQFRDPGGSMYCPYTKDEAPAEVYEVTYSFTGQPLASDEYGNRFFTFHVYFRPEELPSGLRRVLANGKIKRAELATYFDVTTSQPAVRVAVIDETNSSFCEGNYVDGMWMHADPNCQDKVSFKTVTTPSDYLTIQVKPVSSQVSMQSRNLHG